MGNLTYLPHRPTGSHHRPGKHIEATGERNVFRGKRGMMEEIRINSEDKKEVIASIGAPGR